MVHAIQRRYRVENLVRLRSSTEQRRYLASQRAASIDPNPHQIDAVIFALQRIPEGGCILADEVGLGKTIEAGLVISQMLAEGAQRILVITPKALLGQWCHELFDLFSIEAKEYTKGADVDLALPGVYLMSRDFAGGERGADLLKDVPSFDLCIIDEAHEIFAGIYKRYDRDGMYQPDSKHAKMAGRVKQILHDVPVLLLTATPIQNSLTELWGLAQFVERTGTLFGNLSTFRQIFCSSDDRQLTAGQEQEMHKRVSQICKRTLRRQAQEFMTRPFVGRNAQLFEYAMSKDERLLYDDVSAYLLEPKLCAFRGSQRRLLLIGFHRRMASSSAALAASLDKVVARLEGMLVDDQEVGSNVLLEVMADLEDEVESTEEDVDESTPPTPEEIAKELELVRSLASRAKALPSDAKARTFLQAINMVMERGKSGLGSGKVVVFTESITTQNYLRDVLVESGLATEDVTLFRGTNDCPRAQEALSRYRKEVEGAGSAKASKEIAIRQALIHEFKTSSSVFIATEAGAKGLNLQFAGILINYDLPWNPQRIEQRIGRIHRYGQKRDVLVINFVAKDNEAQRLTLDILTKKLELFGTVLGASDEVLHRSNNDAPETLVGALSAEFETRIRRIHSQARSQSEIETELRMLREEIGESRKRFESTHERTASLIESHFDDKVQRVFRRIQETLSEELQAFDKDLKTVAIAYLESLKIPFEHQEATLQCAANPALPTELKDGFSVQLGANDNNTLPSLHLGHPLIRAAVQEARLSTAHSTTVAVLAPKGMQAGIKGRMQVSKIRYSGFEVFEELLPIAIVEDSSEPMTKNDVEAILQSPSVDHSEFDVSVNEIDFQDAVDEFLFDNEVHLGSREEEQYSKTIDQIEMSVEDRVLLLQRKLASSQEKLASAIQRRDDANGAESRSSAEKSLQKIETAQELLTEDLNRLQRREDEEYSTWMANARKRRAKAPSVELLMDVHFTLVDSLDCIS